MNKLFVILFIVIINLCSCAPNNNMDFTHIVLFDLKDELSESEIDEFYKQIGTLSSINLVHDFRCGPFKDLGDDRTMAQYEAIMQMSFKSKADYDSYQNHELHLNLKKNIRAMLQRAPIVYDYTIN